MSDAADDDDAPQTADELRAKLDEYERSLADVEASLADAPGDEELIDLKDSLEDVIEITRDVLATTLAARDDVDDDELGAGDGANDARGATRGTRDDDAMRAMTRANATRATATRRASTTTRETSTRRITPREHQSPERR